MGLFDGLALDGSDSNAALARLLDLPVVLVLDTRGMTRGVAPLILGYQDFDRNLRIAGVILNRVGGRRHEQKLRSIIEHYTDVPVLGAVQEDAELALVERHLGLMPANEAAEAGRMVATIAERVTSQVDLERLLVLTATSVPLPAPPLVVPPGEPPLRIAIAQDAAFGFYYTDDLDALVAAGAELIPFDTLKDNRLPACDALFIGGGFPESFLDELAANTALRTDIRAAIERGLPTYAECGGLMYLSNSITWHGKTRPMVGIIDGAVTMHKKPVGRGYVILEPLSAHPWNSTERPHIHAHEFHYSEIHGLPESTRFAYAVRRGHGVDGQYDGIVLHNLLASYAHLRATAGCDWTSRFVQFARSCRAQPHP